MTSSLVFGATGLCGLGFVKAAASNTSISNVIAFTRRPLPNKIEGVENTVNGESDSWPQHVPQADIVFSSLSTTRGAAGGLEAQYKIDHDFNIELAKAAKAKGAKTFVLVSSAGASVDSMLPYLKLKGECERDIIALKFDKTIILRPGPLLGERQTNLKSWGSDVFSKLSGYFYDTPVSRLLGTPVYGDQVGLVGLDGALKEPAGVHIIDSGDIVTRAKKLGLTH